MPDDKLHKFVPQPVWGKDDDGVEAYDGCTVAEADKRYGDIKSLMRRMKITKVSTYIEIARTRKDLRLPSVVTLKKTEGFRREVDSWASFFGEKFDGRLVHWGSERVEKEYDLIKQLVQEAKIKNSGEYEQAVKEKVLDIPPTVALRNSRRFKEDGEWSSFLGDNYQGHADRWDVGRVDKEYDQIKIRARSAQISGTKTYRDTSRDRKDLDLPAINTLKKSKKFKADNGWEGFLGDNYIRHWSPEDIELRYEKIKRIAQAAGIQRSDKYAEQQRFNKQLNLPTVRLLVASKKFIADGGWDGFLGRTKTPEQVAAAAKTEKEEKTLGAVRDALKVSTKEGKLFRQLLDIVGREVATDIVFAFVKDAKFISIKKVGAAIVDSLGDYVPPGRPPLVENLAQIVPLLDHIEVDELVFAAIKRDCQRVYFERKRVSEEPDAETIIQYFESLREGLGTKIPQKLDRLLARVQKYFLREVMGIRLPKRITPRLVEGRPFPDMYQRINIAEVKTHKKFLIADEMGTGKSASAILAKESIGAQCALVVVPAHVTTTWGTYLSDTVENGKQKGYFKTGQAPRTLIIEKPEDIRKNRQAMRDGEFEYIVISKDKLQGEYMEALEETPYDMLIADEVHEFKRGDAGARGSALLRLSNKLTPDQHTLLLSGTPVPNKVSDIAMLFKLLYPDVFGAEPLRNITKSIIEGNMLASRAGLLNRMQMKRADRTDMPEFSEVVKYVDLGDAERAAMDAIVENPYLTSQQKLQELELFLLNGASSQVLETFESAKVVALREELKQSLRKNKKVIIFVNEAITNVIRGDHSIIERLDIPPSFRVGKIYGHIKGGDANDAQKKADRDAFRNGDQPMVLFVSGDTENTGVDYTMADDLIFYSLPWLKTDQLQQAARVGRFGQQHPIRYRSLVARGTLEEAKYNYMQRRYAIIERLLHGESLTDEERDLISQDAEGVLKEEIQEDGGLADAYLSRVQRLMKEFGKTKNAGEAKYSSRLDGQGSVYAESYESFKGRAYFYNAGRICATMIARMAKEKGVRNPQILDMASGPAMVYRHAPEHIARGVVSLDLNRNHFEGKDLGMTVVGSFNNLPFPNGNQFDFVNCSFAIQDSGFEPHKGNYERIHVFAEAARVLKVGGRFILNMLNTADFRNEELLADAVSRFGLKLVPEYTGEVSSNSTYKGRILTFEKVKDVVEPVESIIEGMPPSEVHSFWTLSANKQKIKSKERKMSDSSLIISEITLNDTEIPVYLSREDRELQKEEQAVIAKAAQLIARYGGKEDVLAGEFKKNGYHYSMSTSSKRRQVYKVLSNGSMLFIK